VPGCGRRLRRVDDRLVRRRIDHHRQVWKTEAGEIEKVLFLAKRPDPEKRIVRMLVPGVDGILLAEKDDQAVGDQRGQARAALDERRRSKRVGEDGKLARIRRRLLAGDADNSRGDERRHDR
jgi:transcription antitermination factor NusA-like protein